MLLAKRSDIRSSYISYFSNLVKAHGGINLAQGIPGFDPPARLLDLLAETRAQRAHQYAPGTGNLDLLEQLRQKYAGNFNKTTSDFFVVNGATEAISLIYTLLFRRHGKDLNVLAFSPAYESYIHLPRLFGNKLFFQFYDQQGNLNLQEFENQLEDNQIKLVFLCSPGNPWGRIASKETLSAICDLCEKHGCNLIIDAVYRELWYSEAEPWYPTNRISKNIYYVNSFSKVFSITGWRIGYLLAHRDNLADLEDVHDYIGLSSPAPMQAALARFMDEKEVQERYITGIKSIIAGNFKTQGRQLSDHGFHVPAHEGGYFIWTRCPDHISSGVDFAIDLYNRHQTAVIPGAHFGKEWEQYIRINLALPSEILEEGIRRVCLMAKR
jgi:aspartate/methionine/tyrosine aminotransferase